MFFLRTDPLDFYFDGRPRGTCHIDFASKDSVVAAKTSIAEKPLQIRDRNLRIEYSDGIIRKQNAVPSYKLFYSGCNCDESEILAIFQQFSESILKVFRCMLFTLSNSVLRTHTE